MSVWATVCGSATLNKSCGYSIRTAIRDLFDECIIRKVEQKETQFDKINVSFEFTFCGDSVGAATDIQRFVDAIKLADRKAFVACDASICF